MGRALTDVFDFQHGISYGYLCFIVTICLKHAYLTCIGQTERQTYGRLDRSKINAHYTLMARGGITRLSIITKHIWTANFIKKTALYVELSTKSEFSMIIL